MKFIKVIIVITIIIIFPFFRGFFVLAQDASSSAEQNPTPTQVENFSPSPSPITISPSPTPTIISPTIPPIETPVPPTPTPTQEPLPTKSFTLPSPTDILNLLTGTPSPASESAEKSGTPSATPKPSLAGFTGASGLSARIRRPINIRLLSKKDLKASEKILFNVDNTDGNAIIVNLYNDQKEKVEVNLEKEVAENGMLVKIFPPRTLKPGKYTVKVSDQTGKTEEETVNWGNLVLNINKNIYSKNDKANLSMTVIGLDGKAICSGDLTLKIQSEKANIDEELSTENGKITRNQECNKNKKSNKPDYEVTYQVKEIGTYILTLIALIPQTSQIYTISDYIEVKENEPLIVERNAPTKISPKKDYPVTLNITANIDFKGQIVETVPDSFEVNPLDKAVNFKSQEEVSENPNDNILGAATTAIRPPFDTSFIKTLGFAEQSDNPKIEKEYKNLGLLGHDGIDFDIPIGTQIKAVAEGNVELARNSDYGETVVISHPWGKSFYGHLSKIYAKEGQKISKGEVLGLSGESGFTTGPHLHFGLKPEKADLANGFYGKIDPAPFLDTSLTANLKVKKLTWDLNLKKGEKITLGYNFTTLYPERSRGATKKGDSYLLGPLKIKDSSGVAGRSLGEGQDSPEVSGPTFTTSHPWQLISDSVTEKLIGNLTQRIRKFTLKERNNPHIDIKADELPEFELDLTDKKFEKIWSAKSSERKDIVLGQIKHKARDLVEISPNISFDTATKKLTVIPEVVNDFKPGLYHLSLKAPTENGEVNITQDFTWGVLAINTNKSIYSPNETIKLGMAVLDDYGRTKCLNAQDDFGKAKLWLTIKTPTGETYDLSTDNGQIKDSGQCGVHSVTNEADFQAVFSKATTPGIYQMHLEGENHNGKRSIDDIFKVEENLPFDVERTSFPTRIYPPADYTGTFTIRANQDFEGTIEESLPTSFELKDQNPDYKIAKVKDKQTLSWTAKLKKGDIKTLTYTFDAPNISPEFYLLGSLTITKDSSGVAGRSVSEGQDSPEVSGNFGEGIGEQSVLFSESRSWQIAADVTKTWDGGAVGTNNTYWSKANNWNNNTLPATGDDIVFDNTSTKNNVWDTGLAISPLSVTYNSTYTGTTTFSYNATITGAFTWQSGTGGTLTFTGSLALSVGGAVTMTSAATFTPNTSTLTMTGTANLDTAKILYKLTINGTNNTVTVVNNSPSVSNILTIGGDAAANTDILSISSGLTVTSTSVGTVTLTDSTDSITGAGKLVIQNSNLGTNGTISAIVRYDTSGGNITMKARDYGSDVEVFSDSAASARTVTMGTAGSQTITINGSLYVIADSTNALYDLTLTAVSWDPTVNITGGSVNNLDFTGTQAADEILYAGAGAWTVAGNIDFTGGTFSAEAGSVFTMSGTTKTLTSVSQSFRDLTISGSVTAQDATSVNKDLTVTGTFANGANNLTVGLTSVTNSGSIKVASGGTISQTGGTTTVVSSASSLTSCIGANSSDCTGTPGTIGFYNLTIGNASTSFTKTINGTSVVVTVGGTLNITTGATLSANGTLNVAGDWTKTGGFTANSSEVVLNGSGTQTLSGATTFYKLTASSAGGRTINFPSSTTTTVSNTLTLSGTSCASQLTLAPSTPSTAWTLTAPAGTTVTYISVSYSTSTNAITANNSTDGGSNNANWTINSCSLSVAGTIYLANETTQGTLTNGGPCNNNSIVTLLVNGAGSQTTTCSSTDASYNFSTVSASAGDTITIYLTSTDKANRVYVSDASADTGMSLFINAIVVADEQDGTVTNADLSDYDNSNNATDMLFDADAGAMNTDASTELHVWAGDIYAPGGAVTISGSLHNAGTMTWSTNTATFDATNSGNYLSGTLNGSSAFYKVNFNGSGGVWTIQDAMLVTAANATDTLQVTAGTVTLGDGTGTDNLEVDGKFVVSSGATFQTLSTLAQGSTITININAPSSPPVCANCIIDVSGTMTINKNATLTFNSNSAVESGAQVSSTGNLSITGSRDVNDTTGAVTGTSETLICASTGNTFTASQHNNKKLVMTSGLAKTRIYDITATTASDGSCSGGSGSSITRADNSSATDTNPTVSISGSLATVTSSVSLITSTDADIARYLHNLTDDEWYLIVDTTEGGTADTIKVIGSPNVFTNFATGDDIEVSDGIKAGDTYEILDYATVTANATNNGYIYSASQSQTTVQYAEISELGNSGSCDPGVTNKCGITVVSVNGYNAGEGFLLSNSYLHDSYDGMQGSALIKGTIEYNNIYNMAHDFTRISGGSKNNMFADNRVELAGDQGMMIQSSSNHNNVFKNNIASRTSQDLMFTGDSSNNNVYIGNTLFRGNNAFRALTSSSGQSWVNNQVFHIPSTGIVSYESAIGQRIVGNQIFNTVTGTDFASTSNTNYTYSINNTYGVETANSGSDYNFQSTAHRVLMFNTKLSSTTKVSNVTAANAFLASFKHDQTAGAAKIWGEYTVPDAIAETSQSEETQKFNYADALYPDSFTPHVYSGTGTEDTSLAFAFSGGSMAGSENHYVYRMTYNGTNWDVYRNESTGTPATATTGSQYTDTTTNAQFTIEVGGTPYSSGNTYTFVIFKGSADTSTQKTATIMQTGDSLTVGSGETIQMLGGSSANQTLLQKDSGATSYATSITGTINASYYKITGTDDNGLNIGTGATVTELSNGVFDDTGGTVLGNSTYVKVVSTVLDAGAKTFTNMTMDDGAADSNIKYNVTLTGTPTACANSWTFNSSGNLGGATNGEANDSDSDGSCSGVGYILWTTYTSGPTTDQQMRHGNWFNSGTEQYFTF